MVDHSAVQAGSMGVVRKDAALAALSSQLAGLQLQAGAGVGRRASMPEPLAGGVGGQADPAVVQVSTSCSQIYTIPNGDELRRPLARNLMHGQHVCLGVPAVLAASIAIKSRTCRSASCI